MLICIPFYNGHGHVAALIERLTTDAGEYKILIVDNSPRESTSEDFCSLVPQNSGVEVTVLRTAPSIGFGRASNAGILWAYEHGHRRVLLLNQDAQISGSILNELDSYMVTSGAAILGGVEVEDASMAIHPQFWDWYLSKPFGRPMPLGEAQKLGPQQVTQVCGSAMCIDIEVAMRDGGFDPAYFMYGEDTEICRRLIQKGHSLTIHPSFIYTHHHSNLSATDAARDQIVAWMRERKTIDALKADRPLLKKLPKVLARRAAEYAYDAIRYRRLSRLRLGWKSDLALWKRRETLHSVLQGESASQRAWNQAQADLRESSERFFSA